MRRIVSTTDLESSSMPPKRIKIQQCSETTAARTNQTNNQENISTVPRSYQNELVEQAKLKNLVVCLPTGSGKTYIAVMLIKEMASDTLRSIDDKGKRTVFLVLTVALVEQQSVYIRIHTGLSVGKYYGELGVDLWAKDQWIGEFENHQVLVFTAKVFLDLVDHNYFPLDKVNLLIFDECQHSAGQNSYAALMERHYDKCNDPPRILGLTASICAKKINPDKFRLAVKDIEKTYRARVTSGSNLAESNRYGTSAACENMLCLLYRNEICQTNESITIPFDILQAIISDIELYLSEKKSKHAEKEGELVETILHTNYLGQNLNNYNNQSIDYVTFLQTQNVKIPKLKQYLSNLIHVGEELGIYGMLLTARELRKTLQTSQNLNLISDVNGKNLFDESLKRLDCVIFDILENLIHINKDNDTILFSDKLLKLFNRIQTAIDKNNLEQCIVFVQQIQTAITLSKLLVFLDEKYLSNGGIRLQVKHLTGMNTGVEAIKMTAKYQNEIIRDFRMGKINILVATAIIEEGLDIPNCNLVFRFNKPANFSSYLQSKGRVRAKQNASYVLLIDQTNHKNVQKDLQTYRDYEDILQMIREGFSNDYDIDSNTEELKQLESYQTESGVVIGAVRAAEIIHIYCTILGNGQLCPPRVLHHQSSDGRYTSILSMPANCPVRDDIIREGTSKKLTKFSCYLKMVELLHRTNELNDHCLPYHFRSLIENSISIERRLFKLCDELFETKTNETLEKIEQTVNRFPWNSIAESNIWYLHRITIRNETDKLGFVTKVKLTDIPNFNLYSSNNEMLTVDVTFVNTIDYTTYKNELERFCKYLFETVFSQMVNQNESTLEFNIEKSSYQLLPCLLKNFNEIDVETMSSICNRLNKSLQYHSELSNDEVYTVLHLPNKLFYVPRIDNVPTKRTSDAWPHKTKSESIKTYFDYFQSILPNTSIDKDTLMGSMKTVSKRRINYLHENAITKKQTTTSSTHDNIIFFPVELLHYAPLNQMYYNIFYKLPSILIRITQLYWIQNLRISFGLNYQNDSMLNMKEMQQSVHFKDSLKYTTLAHPLFPLTKLTYEIPNTNNQCIFEQPSTNMLFQAITRRSTGESMDNENLEILGDTFLKFTVSMSLYYRHPSANAGQLTMKKIEEISNANLYRIAIQKRLHNYLYADKLTFSGTNSNWLPPGYVSNETYSHQTVKRKAISDMIEALIGAFLISTNYRTTIQFMHGLGLDVIPLNEQGHIMELPSVIRSTQINHTDALNGFYTEQRFNEIEQKIKYTFQNKAYLIAAFTHPSNFSNRITDCYERLEFFGDAILDFLITIYIFENYKDKITPGQITDIRQDVLNNGQLAYILVACNLHTKILHNSTILFSDISSYVSNENLFPKDRTTEEYLNMNPDQWADSSAPKAFADVFEALVGAVFLDSGNSLEIVWQVIEPLIRTYIDRSIENPHLNPIRLFIEHGGKIKEEYVNECENSRISICIVEGPDGNLVKGHGKTRKTAKENACREAISRLRLKI